MTIKKATGHGGYINHVAVSHYSKKFNRRPGKPGLTKAREAASAIRGGIMYPEFSGLECTGSGFNDYFLLGGKL